MSRVTITHLYSTRGVCSAFVETDKGAVHRVGYLPHEGWFCTCKRGKRCSQIKAVHEHVPVKLIELGGQNVRTGAVPAPACAVMIGGFTDGD